MKFAITVMTIVLMFRGGCCSVVSYNNFTNTNNTNNGSEPVTSTIQSITNNLNLKANSNSSNTTTGSSDEENESALKNIIQCFRADSLFKCFNDRFVRVWREALLNSVRKDADNNPLKFNQSLPHALQDLGKAVYYGFTSFFYPKDNKARSETEDIVSPSDLEIDRGHHKKKKVHKEIKKLVIKVIVAIFLVMAKIKWAFLMIQTILLNNFILVATLFVLSKTFKIWHEIKQKPQIEKQVVVYDNHHQHYDTGEHSEIEDHGHGHGWGWWARSLASQTETTPIEIGYDNGKEYYPSSGKVIRSTESYYEPRSSKRKRRDLQLT